MLTCQTYIIKNSRGKEKDERKGISFFVQMFEGLFGKKGMLRHTAIDIRMFSNEGIKHFSPFEKLRFVGVFSF